MIEHNSLVCCFSGRFDNVHPGHIIQIMRLGQVYSKVLVPVLDYPEQHYPVDYRLQILNAALDYAIGSYEIFPSKIHFAEASKEYLESLRFDIYVSQNIKCLIHVAGLGFKIKYVDRAFDYSASEEYLKQR